MSTMDLSTLMPQQREIVTTLDRPLFVSAGAGSGKTFTLTRRILWALSPESGPFAEHLDQVLAITFTKDAAAEIRERVRAALIEAGMAEEALTVDDSWISTIHGMCSRILRTHALELGIDPAFQVLEEGSAAVLMDRAVEHVLSAARDERGDDADPFAELKTWYPLYGEIGPSGSEMGTLLGGEPRCRRMRPHGACRYRRLRGERKDHGRSWRLHAGLLCSAREQGVSQRPGFAS